MLSTPGMWTTLSDMLCAISSETVNLSNSLYGGRERRELKISTVLVLSLKMRSQAGIEGRRVTISTTETTAKASKKKIESFGGF